MAPPHHIAMLHVTCQNGEDIKGRGDQGGPIPPFLAWIDPERVLRSLSSSAASHTSICFHNVM